jgi:hypothetical protein
VNGTMKLSGWRPFLRRLAQAIHGKPTQRPWRRERLRSALTLETLEERVLPSGVARPTYVAIPISHNASPSAGTFKFNGAFTPAGIDKAYAIDQLPNVANLGAGQTIAVVDAYDNPKFVNSAGSGFATTGTQSCNHSTHRGKSFEKKNSLAACRAIEKGSTESFNTPTSSPGLLLTENMVVPPGVNPGLFPIEAKPASFSLGM